jgi:hydroxymethylbilane synthase
LAEIRPDLRIESLRGNVNTRLQKLDDGEFDAIVLAGSGLIRLGFSGRIAQMLPAETMLPAGGQGALGIETRVEDSRINELIGFLNHQSSALCVRAERAMNRRLEGGCQVPIAAYAELSEAKLGLRGLVGSIDGETILRANLEGDTGNPEQIGINLAEKLLSMGAGEILREIYASGPDSGVKATSGRDS